MSFGLRTTLRPVVWSHIDSHGQNRRRERSPEDEQSSGDQDSSGFPPPKKKKKEKALGLPALYYPPTLSPSEKQWRDRSQFLFQRGYQLRPRYDPEWTPTFRGNGRHYHSGEDHIMQILPQVLDAIRRHDGLVVCIKMIQDYRKLRQIKITEYFSTRRMTEDSRNHVVPLFDVFVDSITPHIQYMVMPVLRRFDDPEFITVGEVVEFVSQVLEGLTYLHENNVAHHNLTAEHIMMDAKSIVPTGWHFVAHFCEPDGMTRISPLDRRNHIVRYYFIGFGNCYHIAPKTARLVRDIGGNDTDVPELLTGKPYDPFKHDIYTLGNVFEKEIYQKYHGIHFLKDLIGYMRQKEFELRPKAEMVLNAWYSIRGKLNEDVIEELPLRYREGVKPRYTTTTPPTSATYHSHSRGDSGSRRRSANAFGSGSNGHPGSNGRSMIDGYPGAGSYPTSASYSSSSGHSSMNGRSVSNGQSSSGSRQGHGSISNRPRLPAGQPVAGPSGRPRA